MQTVVLDVKNVKLNKTTSIVNFHCLNKKYRVCNADLVVLDTLGNIVHTVSGKDSSTIAIRHYVEGQFKLVFKNTENIEKMVSLGAQCNNCEKNPDFLQGPFIHKSHLEEKLARAKEIQAMISSLMLHTTKTKRTVAAFTGSNGQY